MYCMVLNKLFGIYIDDKNGLSACIDIYLSSMYMNKHVAFYPRKGCKPSFIVHRMLIVNVTVIMVAIKLTS